ncbi:MAG: tetratricopeptide repeat protein [Deltaproteobacteria bacterium]|nr:tetratricopeptide repeat protein [Deltaproteobacteria bacterium]
MIEVINDSVSQRQFVTAHHFALFLPIKDFSTLKDLKDKYIDTFGSNKDQQILNEGLLLFQNLLNHVENKAAVLVNLAYFEEYLNPDDADQLILKALEGHPPLEYIIKFYRWLREKQKRSDYLERLSIISQKANNEVLQKFCKKSKEINLSSRNNDSILVINKLENLISEFRDDIDVVEIGKWINRVLNSASDGLENLGNSYSKSSQGEEAIRYYKEALKGFRIFIEVRPDEATNFASMVIILGKILDELKELKINGDKRKEVIEQVRTYSGQAIELMPQLHKEKRYFACRKYGFMFEILGKLNKGDAGISYFQKGVEWFNKAAERFKPPNDPIAEMRLLQTDAIAKGNCLRKLQRYDEAIKGYETILAKYPDWYEGYLEKGNTLMEMGVENYEEAEKWHKKCIELKPLDIPAYDSLSILYEKWGKYRESILTLVKGIRLPRIKNNIKSLDWYYFKLARLWEDSGNDKVAANLFKYIISNRQPDHAEAHYRLAVLYMKSFDWESAIEVFQKKISIAGNRPFSDYCYIGDCNKNMGEREQALEFYNKAESIAPQGIPVLQRLAKFYEEQDTIDKAIEYVTKIISVADPNEVAADLIWRGILYKTKGEPHQAYKDCCEALKLYPLSEKGNRLLNTLLDQIDIDKVETQINVLESSLSTLEDTSTYKNIASSLLQQYIQSRNPDFATKALSLLDSIYSSDTAEHWFYKASILKELKYDIGGAMECYSWLLTTRLLSENQRLKTIASLIKWHFEAKQEYQIRELIQQLEKVKPLDSFYESDTWIPHELIEAYDVITQFLLKEGNYRDALRYAEILEKIDPYDKVYLTWRGRALIGLKRLVEADKVFDHVISINQDDTYAYFYKGEVMWKQGRLGEAKPYYKEALKLSKVSNDKKGILSNLNRLIKIYTIEDNHPEVIETATEFLNIEDDIIIRIPRAISLIALNQKEKGLEDFKYIFEKDPSDDIAARKLISSLGFTKGYNHPDKIKPLFNLVEPENPVFISNILRQLTNLSIFTKLFLIKEIFEKYSHNSYIRSSAAHYLMKYAIFHYFFNRDYLKQEIERTIRLFKSLNDDMLFKELLVDYWGSEKNAYLEFYADMFEKDFTKIDQMIAELHLENLEVEKTQSVVTEIENLEGKINKPESHEVNLYNPEITNPVLLTVLKYMEKTFKEFISISLDKGYWDDVKSLVEKLDMDAPRLLDDCVNYTLLQINTLAKLGKEDLKSSVAPYHKIKNNLGNFVDAMKDEIKIELDEDDQKEIRRLQKLVQAFIETCRFPKFENVSPFEIGKKLSDVYKHIGIPVQFFLEDIDDDDLIYADPLRFQDCIENLIFNAHDAIREKGDVVDNKGDYIHLKFFKHNGKFGISCKDTGIGMSLDVKTAFERGETKSLGAKCILRFVKNHKGEMFVDSEQGQGTKIKILLDIQEEKL